MIQVKGPGYIKEYRICDKYTQLVIRLRMMRRSTVAEPKRFQSDDHLSGWVAPCTTSGCTRCGPATEKSRKRDDTCQFAGSRFGFDDLVELRSFFLGGWDGDRLEPLGPDSLESDLGRFSPLSFGDRPPDDVSEVDVPALEVGQNAKSASGFRSGGSLNEAALTRGPRTCGSDLGIFVRVVHVPPSLRGSVPVQLWRYRKRQLNEGWRDVSTIRSKHAGWCSPRAMSILRPRSEREAAGSPELHLSISCAEREVHCFSGVPG